MSLLSIASALSIVSASFSASRSRTQRCAVGPAGRLLLVIALALPGLGACQAQHSPAATVSETAEDDLLARIRSAIGDASCTSDAQCRTLAIGEKACGGPQSWLAWSAVSTASAPLQAWASELAALARHRNQVSGRVSNCQYNADPGAVCEARRCVLRGSAP